MDPSSPSCEIDSGFLSPDDVRRSTRLAPLYPIPAVYYLYDDAGTLLYIGQTGNLATRLAAHRRDPAKAAVATFAFRVEADDQRRLEIESCAILHHRPPLNKVVMIRVSKGKLSEIRFRRGATGRRAPS